MLLLVAWFCANSPQTALFSVLSWVDEARHFSHQQRLVADVAHLLGGETPPAKYATLPADAPADPLPPVPIGAVLKKIDLTLEVASSLAPPMTEDGRLRAGALPWAEAMRAAPPHEPPRGPVVTQS